MVAEVDTLQIYNRLKSAKMDERAAREIAAIFNDIISQNLVTKRDLRESTADIKLWVAGMLIAQSVLIFGMFKLFK